MRLHEKYGSMTEDEILAHPDLAHDIQQTKSVDDENTKEFLKKLADGIEQRILVMSKELAQKPEKMDAIKKNTEACLAYLKTPTTNERD